MPAPRSLARSKGSARAVAPRARRKRASSRWRRGRSGLRDMSGPSHAADVAARFPARAPGQLEPHERGAGLRDGDLGFARRRHREGAGALEARARGALPRRRSVARPSMARPGAGVDARRATRNAEKLEHVVHAADERGGARADQRVRGLRRAGRGNPTARPRRAFRDGAPPPPSGARRSSPFPEPPQPRPRGRPGAGFESRTCRPSRGRPAAVRSRVRARPRPPAAGRRARVDSIGRAGSRARRRSCRPRRARRGGPRHRRRARGRSRRRRRAARARRPARAPRPRRRRSRYASRPAPPWALRDSNRLRGTPRKERGTTREVRTDMRDRRGGARAPPTRSRRI